MAAKFDLDEVGGFFDRSSSEESDSESEEEYGTEVYCYHGKPVIDRAELSALGKRVASGDVLEPASRESGSDASLQQKGSSGGEGMELDSPGDN